MSRAGALASLARRSPRLANLASPRKLDPLDTQRRQLFEGRRTQGRRGNPPQPFRRLRRQAGEEPVCGRRRGRAERGGGTFEDLDRQAGVGGGRPLAVQHEFLDPRAALLQQLRQVEGGVLAAGPEHAASGQRRRQALEHRPGRTRRHVVGRKAVLAQGLRGRLPDGHQRARLETTPQDVGVSGVARDLLDGRLAGDDHRVPARRSIPRRQGRSVRPSDSHTRRRRRPGSGPERSGARTHHQDEWTLHDAASAISAAAPAPRRRFPSSRPIASASRRGALGALAQRAGAVRREDRSLDREPFFNHPRPRCDRRAASRLERREHRPFAERPPRATPDRRCRRAPRVRERLPRGP